TIRIAVEPHRPFIGRVRAREHLHERALARAVLADQCMVFARPDDEVDSVQRDGRSEALADARHLEVGGGGHCACSGRRRALISGWSMFSGVAMATPVSTRFSTAEPRRWETIVFTARYPMLMGFWSTVPWSSPLLSAATSRSEVSNPTNLILPASLAVWRARSMPIALDSFGAKSPSILRPPSAVLSDESRFSLALSAVSAVAPAYWFWLITSMSFNLAIASRKPCSRCTVLSEPSM